MINFNLQMIISVLSLRKQTDTQDKACKEFLLGVIIKNAYKAF